MRTLLRAIGLVFCCCVLFADAQIVQLGFEVQIDNLSGASILPSALSGAVWAVYTGSNPLFTVGSPASPALQLFSATGNGTMLSSGLSASANALSFGFLQTATPALPGFNPAGTIAPGGTMNFGIRGKAGDKFTFATMYVESNDDFYGPDQNGISLFDSQGNPLSGIYNAVLYNAGSQNSEPPGSGANQILRQPNIVMNNASGVVAVQALTTIYPAAYTVIRVTITAATMFRIRLENIGNGTGLSPPAWAVARIPGVFFTLGALATPGLRNLAENGNNSGLLAEAAAKPQVLFTGSGSSSPIVPGTFAEFQVPATPGSLFYLASMYAWSNDRFWSTPDVGLSLFTAGGPLSNNLDTDMVLYDAGTATDQAPGVGSNQVLNRNGPNLLPSTMQPIKNAIYGNPDGFVYQSTASTLRLSITPIVAAPGYTSSVPVQNVYVSFAFNGMVQP